MISSSGARVRRFVFGILGAAALSIASAQAPSAPPARAVKSPDPTQVRKRADDILRQMTLEEKVGQLGQVFYFGGKPNDDLIRTGQVGSVLAVSDAKQINRVQKIAVEESRLHVPLLIGLDVIHGLRTIFPVPLALAASWDPALVERVQETAAHEARASGIHWTFAPMVDIARDPRWGRIVEGAGEDPFLGSAMAAAQVRGFQGGSTVQPGHILAGVKHFAGYGAATGGRDYDEVNLSDSELWNVYLPPFKAAIDAGAGNVMAAYMDLNGVPAAANHWLLTDVLRKTWGFKGFVVSDANDVHSLVTHGFAADKSDAAIRALQAGLDMEMSFGPPATKQLVQAVKDRRIELAAVEGAARRILEAKIALSVVDQPYVDESTAVAVLAAPEHRVLAQTAAERSAVLLRNEGNVLPLQLSKVRSIAVIGPFAESQRDMLGPWVIAQELKDTDTIAAALREKVGSGVKVDVAPGVERPLRMMMPSPFAALEPRSNTKPWTAEERAEQLANAQRVARNADIVVLALGQAWDMTGEVASASSLSLPPEQQQLMESIVAIGKPVVLVLMSGRPLDITWAAEHVPAILAIWHPGSRGGAAVANLLCGDAVPGGKLPVTWPREVGQVPLFYARTLSHEPFNADKRYWNAKGAPLYPFGFGLSYTTFAISEPRLERTPVRLGQPLRVSVDVKNTGERAGDEVVQLYIHQRAGRASRPVRELKGFQRVTLAPGEARTLAFDLSAEMLKYWSAADKAWVQDAARFDLWVGADSQARAHAEFEVTQ